ncbi:MAG: NADPH-dependent FMN reductase [Bernardetiaceae bacterium]
MKIAIISGSTRPGRNSHRLALALEQYLKNQADTSVQLIDLAALDLPPFVERLRLLEDPSAELLAASTDLKNADAVILVSPEYNGSFSSALKGFVDRMGKDELGGKPIGVATASTGAMGGMRAALALQQLILAVQAYPQPQMLLCGQITQQIDETGALINPDFLSKIETFAQALLSFAQKMKA